MTIDYSLFLLFFSFLFFFLFFFLFSFFFFFVLISFTFLIIFLSSSSYLITVLTHISPHSLSTFPLYTHHTHRHTTHPLYTPSLIHHHHRGVCVAHTKDVDVSTDGKVVSGELFGKLCFDGNEIKCKLLVDGDDIVVKRNE